MQEKNIITQSKKEFQSMLSTFSHEIRNPLALITSEMQMLSDSQPQLCFNEHWDNIMENLNYIRELLDELSRYQNAGHISLVQTNLSICLDRITSSFRPALDYLGISFETDIPRDLPQISLDQTKIRQALFNLLRMRRNLSSILTAKSFFPLLPFRTVSRSPSRITDVA